LLRFILSDDLGGYASTGGKSRGYFHPSRSALAGQVVQYSIGKGFVKDALAAVTLHIEFEALEFDTKLVGTILDDDFAEIGLTCPRTNACELRTSNGDTIIPLGTRIIE
jgi:hypothetical protein